MAYAPTTWDANDVITKDKLNKIEQGINTASKLSGTDIDTDKNWNGKRITNIGGISGAAFTPNVADMVFIHRPDPNKNPGNIVASDLDEVSTNSTSFVLAKTFPAAPAAGYIEDPTSAVKVSFEIYSGNTNPGYRAEVEIRVGDEVRGGPIEGPSSSYVERSVDVEVQPGEVLTIWLRTGSSFQQGKVRNVKIYSMRHPLLAPAVAW